MRVLFLGRADSPVLAYLREVEAIVEHVGPDEPFDATDDVFVVSHGYRRILHPAPVQGINLHISYLPWNRGTDPNLWSWIDDTPKGVSIHYIDNGVDTGDLIAQQRVWLAPTHTLASSYAALLERMTDLFREQWPLIRSNQAMRWKQPPGGTYHRSADRASVEHLLHRGWDTPVTDLFY